VLHSVVATTAMRLGAAVGRGPRVGLVPRPTLGLRVSTPLALAGQEPDDAKLPPCTPACAGESHR
jgi:hypothetical protein